MGSACLPRRAPSRWSGPPPESADASVELLDGAARAVEQELAEHEPHGDACEKELAGVLLRPGGDAAEGRFRVLAAELDTPLKGAGRRLRRWRTGGDLRHRELRPAAPLRHGSPRGGAGDEGAPENRAPGRW